MNRLMEASEECLGCDSRCVRELKEGQGQGQGRIQREHNDMPSLSGEEGDSVGSEECK